MAVVTMPDGAAVELPDTLTPEQGARLRALHDAQSAAAGGKMALEGMSGTDKFLAGAGKGMTDVVRSVKQAFGLGDQQAIDEAKSRDAALSGTGAGMAGEIAGNLALTAFPGAGLQSGLTRGAAAILPRILAPAAGAAAAGGIVAGVTDPTATGESTAQKIGYGAAGGALGDTAVRVAARVAQPMTQSPAVQRLLSEGVVPTPGQAAGADSLIGRTEQKLTSTPGVGDIIKLSRDRAREEFNRASLNRAMTPGSKVSQAGNAGLEQVDDALSEAYGRIFNGKTVQPNQALAEIVNSAKEAPLLPLNDANKELFDKTLKKVFWDRVPTTVPVSGGTLSTSVSQAKPPGAVLTMPADRMKSEIIGDLGRLARDHMGPGNSASDRALGEAFMAARNGVQQWLAAEVAKTSPAAAAQIAGVDRAWANKVMLAKGVERAKAAGGMMTPNQLQQVTKPGQPLRELANDAQATMGSTVGDSGTTARALTALALGAGGAEANNYFGGPGYLSALAAAPLLYSRAGSRYAVGNLPGQQSLAELLRQAAPLASQVGRAGAETK